MQVNLAMLTVHVNYVKQRVDIVKRLSVSDWRIGRQRHAKDSWNGWEHPGGNTTPSPTIGDRVCLYEAEGKKVRRILTN